MRKLGLMLMVLSFWMPAHGEAMLGTAILVIDGNTFELKTDENETYKIILFGVDCPEPGQPFAEDAKNALEKLILRQKIAVDVVGKDRHGVRLGVVQIKNRIDPRKELLKDGLAWTAERDPQVELEARDWRPTQSEAEYGRKTTQHLPGFTGESNPCCNQSQVNCNKRLMAPLRVLV